MNYLTKYYIDLCEQLEKKINFLEALDPKLQAQLAELDRRKKEREENKKLKAQTDAAFAEKNRKEDAPYNIPNMPNLSANIEFSSQSRARSGSGIPTPTSELDAFTTLGADKQGRIASGLSTSTLKGMQQAQYDRSKGILGGRSISPVNPALNRNSVATQNLISKTLDDRKGPLGGRAGAQSYVDTLNRTGDTKSLYGKSYDELKAMRDELDQQIRAGFKSGNKTIDPTKRRTLMDLNTAIDTSLKSKIKRNF